MSQYAIYLTPGKRSGFVVDIQSQLLNEISTRVVVPLVPRHQAPSILAGTLNPILLIAGGEHVLMTQAVASVPRRQLGEPVGSLALERDQIVRAIDALRSGI